MTPLKLPTALLHDQANACIAQWVAQLPTALPPEVVLDAADLTDQERLEVARSQALRACGHRGNVRVLPDGVTEHAVRLSDDARGLPDVVAGAVLRLAEQADGRGRTHPASRVFARRWCAGVL